MLVPSAFAAGTAAAVAYTICALAVAIAPIPTTAVLGFITHTDLAPLTGRSDGGRTWAAWWRGGSSWLPCSAGRPGSTTAWSRDGWGSLPWPDLWSGTSRLRVQANADRAARSRAALSHGLGLGPCSVLIDTPGLCHSAPSSKAMGGRPLRELVAPSVRGRGPDSCPERGGHTTLGARSQVSAVHPRSGSRRQSR